MDKIIKGAFLILLLILINFNFDHIFNAKKIPETQPKKESEALLFKDRKIEELTKKVRTLEVAMSIRDVLDRCYPYIPPEKKGVIASSIAEASERYQIDPKLILAVIETESAFKIDAISNKGAIGLMQVIPATGLHVAKELKLNLSEKDSLFDPVINVLIGSYYLKELMKQYKNLEAVLTAYNMGPGTLETQGLYRLPKKYSERVKRNYQELMNN
ncbi:MAG: lytic transglycosylase domain-containing protein [Acidobacteria bacterium]|nr:lytic transglycosylase domain-containing protein [Acidobacteriota bacterium]